MSDPFVHLAVEPEFNLYVLETARFKTTHVYLFFHQPLRRETVTANALLPEVLLRGCEGMPTALDIARHMQSLYGAELAGDIVKKGERQLLQFSLEIPSERFLPDARGLFRNGLAALARVVTQPVLEAGAFRSDYVGQEKENLRRRIESLINDKRSYAVARCFQEMCRGEPFGVYKYGLVEDLPGITPQSLAHRYEEVLRGSPVDLFVIGAVPPDEVAEVVSQAFRIPRRSPVEPPATSVRWPVKEVRRVEERRDVSQGKLSLGLRTQIGRGDPDFYPLLVANGVLGGGAHSKLFQNVRERASLAYYAFSQLEVTKGVMVMSCGIDFAKYEDALHIMREQLADLQAGRITDQEWRATKNSLILDTRTAEDRPDVKVLLYLDSLIAGRPETAADRLAAIERVTQDEAVAAARKIELDTIYFLNRSAGAEEAGAHAGSA